MAEETKTKTKSSLKKRIIELVRRVIKEDYGNVTIESIRIWREYNAREGVDEYIAIARIYDTPFPWQVRFRMRLDLLGKLCLLEAIEEDSID